MADLWNNDEPIVKLTDLEVPAWIEDDISPCDVAAIQPHTVGFSHLTLNGE